MSANTHIVVLGAGVLGLTNAFELRERGYKVTILARDLPQDSFSQTFASPWAGANWCSFATLQDKPSQRRDAITFQKWLQLHKQLSPEIMAMVDFTDITPHKREAQDVWYSSLVPDFAVLPNGDGQGWHAIKYKSFTIGVPLYTKLLVSELTSPKPSLMDATRAGPSVEIRRCSTLSSLSAVRALIPSCHLIVNATGVGAGDLAEVKDPEVYPIRGQCLSQCLASELHLKVLGQVILGGSFDIRQSSTTPDKVLAEKILQERAKLVPEIIPEGKTWKEIDVLSHNVGLRPARENGVRVELETLASGAASRGLTVVHSYGIGPAGYPASFGIANEVADLVDGHVATSGGKAQAKL